MFAASKTASVSGGYQISRSLRFNSADSAYLNRTPASATNRQTWTFSTWIKRSKLTGSSGNTDINCVFTAYSDTSNYLAMDFATTSTNAFAVSNSSAGIINAQLVTTATYRDPSAWYHFVVSVDTTQATASNRIKIYVNGVEVTALSTATYPSQNTDLQINNNVLHQLGRNPYPSYPQNYDGYMTEVNFIDGQQLTPSSFGETNAQTGVWQPKAFAGTYGTNGFYLNFSDNSNTTAATLGKDYSANGNNWTPNNFSVTAGAGNDSFVDVPTPYGVDTGAGGSVRGNYCIWNPLQVSGVPSFTGAVTRTYTNGNLEIEFGTGSYAGVTATLAIPTSGKWYWEVTASNVSLGISASAAENSSASEVNLRVDGAGIYSNGSAVQTGLASYGTGDIIGLAWDANTNSMQFYKNGSVYGSAQSYTPTSNVTYYPFIMARTSSSTTSGIGNFGQRPFAYTAPSGFKALCTQNLPTPTIGATASTLAGQFFNPVTFSGNNSTNAITVGFAPDFAWVKSRSNAFDHNLSDIIRGNSKILRSNTTGAESTYTDICVFGSNGVTLNANSDANAAGTTSVGWFWKANGSGSTNTAGSITSTVSASISSGFSVVTYTGTGLAGTIGHGLGVAPSMIIVKSRSAIGGWPVYHKSIGNSSNLFLNGIAAAASSSTIWNATSPTSSVFSVGINTDSNTVTVTYVAYCFAEVDGYSKFGAYTGGGGTDGTFVYCGFRPACVMMRNTNGSDWYIFDVARNPYNVTEANIYPNDSAAEGTFSTRYFDILSNGFKMRTSAGPNSSGEPYIFWAFASNPFKYSLAR
jgi:hypothetical protein